MIKVNKVFPTVVDLHPQQVLDTDTEVFRLVVQKLDRESAHACTFGGDFELNFCACAEFLDNEHENFSTCHTPCPREYGNRQVAGTYHWLSVLYTSLPGFPMEFEKLPIWWCTVTCSRQNFETCSFKTPYASPHKRVELITSDSGTGKLCIWSERMPRTMNTNMWLANWGSGSSLKQDCSYSKSWLLISPMFTKPILVDPKKLAEMFPGGKWFRTSFVLSDKIECHPSFSISSFSFCSSLFSNLCFSWAVRKPLCFSWCFQLAKIYMTGWTCSLCRNRQSLLLMPTWVGLHDNPCTNHTWHL